MLGTVPALPAEQMDAADDPRVEGSLTLTDEKCDRKSRTSGKKTVAVIERCLWFYELDPSVDNDSEHDYGIVWLQTNVDGRNGWCAKRVASDILLPASQLRLHDYKPKRRRTIDSPQRYVTRLKADAEGSASEPARVVQNWIAYPERVRGVLRREGEVFRVKWSGTTRAKLGFAGGIEISWAAGAPPAGISYELNFALGSPDSC